MDTGHSQRAATQLKQSAQLWIPDLPIGGGVEAEIKAAMEAPSKISAYALKIFGELKDKICRVVAAGAEGARDFFVALACIRYSMNLMHLDEYQFVHVCLFLCKINEPYDLIVSTLVKTNN